MAKREWSLRKPCVHPGCTEVARYTYATRRDLETSYEIKHEFRCTRHSKPAEVLSVENMTTEVVMVSKKSDGCGDHLFWERNGFQHGPGFKAWANDFPEGTRLIVTARIEFPNAEFSGEGKRSLTDSAGTPG